MQVGIIDYGMGNLSSVHNAFLAVGATVQFVDDQANLSKVNSIVLPGVGAFGKGIQNLRESGFIESLNEEIISKGKPFLGICLGMQLLATKGFENGEHAGLNWVSGVVKKLPDVTVGTKLRIPHVGWNDVSFTKKNGIYSDMGDFKAFYFVHSYCLVPDDASVISGVTEYGSEFVSSVELENIFAVQFHPEKSHKDGLKLLSNFLKIGVPV